jgi:D-3-phosphoglycerate dehydrogenase / 2-oxoglutarate reductase
MHYIHCLNKISNIGLSVLTKDYQITDDLKKANAILVRSASMHELELPKNIIAVARAGAGVNNIPLDRFAATGVVVFNTPGANANAVKELTLAGMLMASRDIFGGMQWLKDNQKDQEVDKTVEKAKAQFAGTEIHGKTMGIIGLGAIGVLLAQSCSALGMKIVGNNKDQEATDMVRDQLPTGMEVFETKEELFAQADFISLNVPLIPETKHLINRETIKQMKDGVIILNFARGALVDDEAIEEALASGKVRCYVTDFPNHRTNNMKGVIAIPHLGASTEEAEDNCAMMAANQIMGFIEEGALKNAVNFSNLKPSRPISNHRIAIIFDSKKTSFIDIIKTINGHQVEHFQKTEDDITYAIIDLEHLDGIEQTLEPLDLIKLIIIK